MAKDKNKNKDKAKEIKEEKTTDKLTEKEKKATDKATNTSKKDDKADKAADKDEKSEKATNKDKKTDKEDKKNKGTKNTGTKVLISLIALVVLATGFHMFGRDNKIMYDKRNPTKEEIIESKEIADKDKDGKQEKQENLAEIGEVKPGDDKTIATLDKVVKEFLSSSFSYDKGLGTYLGQSPRVEVIDKDATEEEILELVGHGRFYTKEPDTKSGGYKLNIYNMTKHMKEVTDEVKDLSLKSKGFFDLYDDKIEVYTENVLFGLEEPKPVLREHYELGKLIKEGGSYEAEKSGVSGIRLPDEPIFTLNLLKTIPLKDIMDASTKTGYTDGIITDNTQNYYVMLKHPNAPMFANEILSILLNNEEHRQAFMDGLKLYGIDYSKEGIELTKELMNQKYPSDLPTLEGMLRSGIRYLGNAGVFEDAKNIENVDTKLPMGTILKQIYEDGTIPFDSSIGGIFMTVVEDTNGNKFIDNISVERIYDEIVGDIITIFPYQNKTPDYEMLKTNSEAVKSLKKFEEPLDITTNAKTRILQTKEYVDMLQRNMPESAWVQAWYEIKARTGEHKGLKLDDKTREYLNGLDRLDKFAKNQPISKTMDWYRTLNRLSIGLDKVKIQTFKGQEGKDYQVFELDLYELGDYNRDMNYLDVDGKKIKKSGDEKEIIVSNQIYNAERHKEDIDKMNAEAEEGTIYTDKPEELESKDFKALSEAFDMSEGKLKSFEDLNSTGVLNQLEDGDGFYEVFRVSYNKILSDLELKDANNKTILYKDIEKDKNKTTMMVYATPDCPFCVAMIKTLSENYKEFTDKYNIIIIARKDASAKAEYDDLLASGRVELDKEVADNLETLMTKHLYFGADELLAKSGVRYKPTLFWLDTNDTVFYVSSGFTDDNTMDYTFKVIESVHDAQSRNN